MKYRRYVQKMKRSNCGFKILLFSYSRIRIVRYVDIFLVVTRSTEWGDHVTLQAAADRVS